MTATCCVANHSRPQRRRASAATACPGGEAATSARMDPRAGAVGSAVQGRASRGLGGTCRQPRETGRTARPRGRRACGAAIGRSGPAVCVLSPDPSGSADADPRQPIVAAGTRPGIGAGGREAWLRAVERDAPLHRREAPTRYLVAVVPAPFCDPETSCPSNSRSSGSAPAFALYVGVIHARKPLPTTRARMTLRHSRRRGAAPAGWSSATARRSRHLARGAARPCPSCRHVARPVPADAWDRRGAPLAAD